MEITEPLILSVGWHGASAKDAGRGCAMEVLSWTMGEAERTDNPQCTNAYLSALVQGFNDQIGTEWGIYPIDHHGDYCNTNRIELQPEHAVMAFELACATVGTGNVILSPAQWDEVRALARRRFNDERYRVTVDGLIHNGQISRAFRYAMAHIEAFRDRFCPVPLLQVPTGADVDRALQRMQAL